MHLMTNTDIYGKLIGINRRKPAIYPISYPTLAYLKSDLCKLKV